MLHIWADDNAVNDSVQCSEDLRNSEFSSSTSPVFYASGSRLYKCSAILDVNRDDNRIVKYSAEQFASAENATATAAAVADVADIVLDRICPYCERLIAACVSEADYERHLQSHVDSDVDDDVTV